MPPAPPPEEAPVENSETKVGGTEVTVLVARARTGDGRAFEELVRRFRPRIYALALHLTGRPSDADDVTQEAFLRAYRKLGQFEGRSEFYTWLYRIALHRAINLRRERGRRTMVDADDPRVLAAVEVDSGGNAERALELKQSYARLMAAFDRLSPTLRTTVALVAMQGLPHKDVARVLDSTEGTIAWRMHEARKQLRVHLEALEHERVDEDAWSGESSGVRGKEGAEELIERFLGERR